MKTLGKFEILERIGQGAMGVVYKARDPRIGRLVALKTITTGLAEDPDLLERFYHEAHSAGALQHPNIVTIYELGEEDHTPFIAMEYLSGQSLDKLIERRHQLPLSQRVGFIAYICRALAYAHKQGVVHRDIKPANVMVTSDGTVKVVDFGIARISENAKSQSGLLIGTLGYMSPQQIQGGRADARSDIWAAGVLFYELLAHRRPFDGENYGALMLNIMKQKAPPLSETAPGTPPDVAAVVHRMLEKEVDERFQSMEETLIALEPVWRRLQHVEASDLLTASQEMFKAGDVTKAYELVRRVLQIDTANAPAKTLLEQINTEVRRNKTVAPSAAEKQPQDDETVIGPALGAIRASLPSIQPATTPPAQREAAQSSVVGDSVQWHEVNDVRRAVFAQPERVAVVEPGERRAEVPTPAQTPVPLQAARPRWKLTISIALVALVVAVAGGGAYFLKMRQPSTPAAEALTAEVAPGSNAATHTDSPGVVPPAPDPVSASRASTDLGNSQAQASRDVAAKKTLDTNTPGRGAPAPLQHVPVNQGAAGQGSAPPVVGRGEVAANNPGSPAATERTEAAVSNAAPPPAVERTEVAANTSVAPPPAERPSQPAISPQPAVAPSQPPVATPIAAAAPVVKAAEPVVSSGPPDNLDQQQIKVALSALSAAFSHRSISELAELWPKNPKQNTYKNSFGAAKAITREFHTQNVTINGDTATAVGTYDGMVNAGNGNTPSSGNFYVRFTKKNGRWYIDDASF